MGAQRQTPLCGAVRDREVHPPTLRSSSASTHQIPGSRFVEAYNHHHHDHAGPERHTFDQGSTQARSLRTLLDARVAAGDFTHPIWDLTLFIDYLMPSANFA